MQIDDWAAKEYVSDSGKIRYSKVHGWFIGFTRAACGISENDMRGYWIAEQDTRVVRCRKCAAIAERAA